MVLVILFLLLRYACTAGYFEEQKRRIPKKGDDLEYKKERWRGRPLNVAKTNTFESDLDQYQGDKSLTLHFVVLCSPVHPI